MTRFTDRDLTDLDLEKMLHSHDDPMPEPPDDLAERIKAEIPDDLEGLFADADSGPDDESAGDGRILSFPGPGARRVLALAAVLVIAAGLTFLMRPWETPRDETPTYDALASDPAVERAEAPAEEEVDDVATPDASDADAPPPPPERRAPLPDPTPDDGSSAELQSLSEESAIPEKKESSAEGRAREMARFSDEVLVVEPAPEPDEIAPPVASRFAGEDAEAPPPPPPAPSKLSPPRAKRAPPTSAGASASLAEPSRQSAAADELRRNPNDAPYDHVYYESAGVNPFVDTEDDRLSTFGLDVDTASYTVVRRHLRDGHLPPKDAVRVEEMVNFFDYGDAPPEESDFALHAEGAPSPWGEGERYHLLRFGIRARDVVETERPPATLVFVVDVSGSMDRENRLGLVKDGLGLLLDHLREDDRVGLVVYGSRGEVLLEPTGDHAEVRRAIDRLRPGGSTNAAEGLRLGYELAARHKEPKRIHRVILCSDGVANTGSTTSSEGILGEVERWARQGIELTTVGFGMGNYNDVLMERLADDGNGRYAYVDNLGEARRLFVEDLTGTLVTVAAEARAQVAFDPEVVSRYRLLGYENRDVADERFRDDTVDAGEIGAGHTVTAVYEIKTRQVLRRRDKIATLTLRYASIEKGEMVEQSETIRGKDVAESFEDAPASLRLAAVVAETAEILRGSYWAREGDLDDVFRRTQKVSADFPGDQDVAEFAALVGRAAEIRGREHQSRE